MAEFLTTNGTSFNLENIILEAKTKLILVSPYLQISKTFFERLKDTSNRNVKIKIIYGKDELNEIEKKQLSELENLELFYFENLHAKIYFNENKMIITSMNMYQFSEKTNREMGVLINRKIDDQLFEKAVNETLSILKSSKKIELISNEKIIIKNYSFTKPTNKNAFCIRCNENIKLDINNPYCRNCLREWERFGNIHYLERFCHYCGENEETSSHKPMDLECFTKWVKE